MFRSLKRSEFSEVDWDMAPSPEAHNNYPEEEEERPLLPTQEYDSGVERQTVSSSGRRKNGRGGWMGGPDGFLAWLVAFANFLINLIVVGLGRMSGILYVVFMDMFQVNRQAAALPFSIQQAARNLFGPLAGILGQKYGVRPVTVVGGVVGVVSAVVCYFATDMTWITIMWGLVFGLCTALTTTLNQVTIDQYFERHRTTAGGLAFSGGCVGAFLFPGLLEWLIHTYGMGRTFLAMAILLSVVMPAATALGEPPWKKRKKRTEVTSSQDVEQKSRRDTHYRTFRATAVPTQLAGQKEPRDTVTEEDFLYLEEQREVVYQLFLLTVFEDADSVLETQWTSIATDPLVQELRNLYHFARFKTSVIADRNATRTSQVGSVMDELTRHVHVVQVTHTDPSGVPSEPHSQSPRESHNYENNPRWIFLAGKLRELSDRNKGDILSYFDIGDYACVGRVLDLMRKVDSAVRGDDPHFTEAAHGSDSSDGHTTKQSAPLNSDISRSSQQNPQQPVKFEALPNGLSALLTANILGMSSGQLESLYPSVRLELDDYRASTFRADVFGSPEFDPQTKSYMSHLPAQNDFSASDANKPPRCGRKNQSKDANSFAAHIRTAVHLHRNPLFLLICLCRGVFMLTFIPMVTVVVDFAIDQGLSRDSGKYVIAILSLGDLLGRLCLGWITDAGCLGLPRYMLLAMLLLGGCSAALPLATSETSLMPGVLVFGMLQGSLFIRHQVLVSKYMEGHEQTIGMGFINMLSGFLGFALPSYIGYFRDTQGSYDGMLYVNGAICACVGLLWVFEPFFKRRTEKENHP